MRILVTGGAGFIGSNFVRWCLERWPHAEVVTLDRLTYAGNLANLAGVEGDPRHRFVRGDIADGQLVGELLAGGVDVIVNFAAESHVDRSIEDAGDFVHTNVEGVRVLLDCVRRAARRPPRFIQVSTDEVYGSLGPVGQFTESSPLRPSSPYAASKAAADLLVQAYVRTYGCERVPAIITRCSNNYGPYQFPEKLIPLFITEALADRPLPLYGDGMHVRDWIYVEDHCSALGAVIERGAPGELYHIAAGNERTNREVTEMLLDILGKPRSLVRLVADRPGHDRRYALAAERIRCELGWAPRWSFAEGLRATVRWYQENRAWFEAVKSGAYRDYYERTYGERLRSTRGPGARQDDGP